MQTTEQTWKREQIAKREEAERAITKKQNTDRLKAAQEFAAKNNATFDKACECQDWQRQEAKIIGYLESIQRHTVEPLVRERAGLEVEAELEGKDHGDRLKQIAATLKECRAKVLNLTGELRELQGKIRERLEWLSAHKVGELH